jgi:NAD-dependent dihydropyrimidine dehydrogenase PreA subunit
MIVLKTVWGIFFRLFPCPTEVGLRAVGNPDRESPVLATCNFYLTARRVTRILERQGLSAWLLVADSKGVNVWCAAGGDEFNTHSVVSALKTSGVAEAVDHRRLILPPLGAPAIRADEVRRQTGWSTRWGPVRAADIPSYLAGGAVRTEPMKRVTYTWRERFDTALGSLFPFFLLGALGVVLLGRHLIGEYLLVGALMFLFFFLLCPWIPGRRGLTKALVLDLILAAVFVGTELYCGSGESPVRTGLIIAAIMALVYGSELGGLASTMPSDLDPFLARLGIGSLGNVEWAGTIRTDLLLGTRILTYTHDRCNGCRHCFEVCPVGVWQMGDDRRAIFGRPGDCTACRGCLTQCPTSAIEARSRNLNGSG